MNDLSRMPKNLSAIKFGKAGFRVLPVKPNSKAPKFYNWQHEATTDRAQIEAWWEEEPDFNIGICTTGLLVVDIDAAKGGLASWHEITEFLEAPPTFTVKTWSGGYHLYFSLKEGQEAYNSEGQIGDWIDIRGDRGQALAPGSVFNGKPYRILTEPENGIVPLLPKKKGELPVAVYAPDWLVRLCAKRAAKKAELAGVRLNEQTERTVDAAIDYLQNRAPIAIQGEGGDGTTYEVGAELGDIGVELDTAYHLMLEEWNERCEPPWDPDDLRVKVESGYRNRQNAIGIKNPDIGDRVFEGVDWPTDEEINSSALKEGVPARVQLAALTPPDRKSWKLITFAQACELALTLTNDPLVADVIYAGQTSVTFGESGASKSFIMLDLAFHVATGLPWHGKPTTQGPVIWLAAEGGFGVYKRIRALAKHYGVDPDSVPLYVLQRPVDLLHEDRKEIAGFTKLIQETQKEIGTHIALIIIDTLNRVMAGGNENGPEDMGQLLDNFERIKAAVGAKLHLNIIHHTGLTLGRARGHTSLKAAADTEIEVAKPGRFTVKKQRDEREGFKFEYSLHGLEDLGTDIKGNKVGSAVVVDRVTEGMAEVSEATDGGRVLRALDKKLEQRSGEHDIPETAPFNKFFLLTAFVAAGLTRRNGEPRTLEGYQDRKSGDRTEFYNLLGEYTKSGVIVVDKKDQYSRVVKP